MPCITLALCSHTIEREIFYSAHSNQLMTCYYPYEPTSWNLLNDLSISICTEHNSFGKCSQIPQRKVRLKVYTSYFWMIFQISYSKYLMCYLFQNLWIWKISTFDDGLRVKIVLNQIWQFIHPSVFTNSG